MYWYGLALVAAAIHTRTSHMTSAALKPCYSVVDAQHSLPWRRTSVQMAKTSVTLLCYLGWSQLPPEEQEITLCFSAKHIGVTFTWHENYAVVHHLHLMQSQGKKAADKNAHNISSYKFLDVTECCPVILQSFEKYFSHSFGLQLRSVTGASWKQQLYQRRVRAVENRPFRISARFSSFFGL